VAAFVGRYEHSLDAKGRIILPAKFRAAFERGGFLTENREGCLALWTPGEFERQTQAMQSQSAANRANRNRARLWAASSHEVEVDRQGRMAIPAHLREFASLEGDVLVHGAIDRIELWNPPTWEERVVPDQRWFTEEEEEEEEFRTAQTSAQT
jgi:MraZ protein